MAKKVNAEPEKTATIEEIATVLIEMETQELQTMLKLRNMMTEMCINKKNTLVLLGKMTGLETGMLESLKVE